MGIAKEALVFALVICVFMVSLKVAIGETDIWGPYYYRQAERTYALGTTLYYDNLSYLGRNFTYPPAYFMFFSQAASIVGARDGAAVIFPLHLLVMFFALFTSYLIFEKFDRRERILASLLLALQTFYFITLTAITLHALAFGMLNCSVLLFRRKGLGPFALGIAALAAAFSAHPLSIFMFPVYTYAAGGLAIDKKTALKMAAFGAGAVFLSLPLYMPIFLKSGLPNEIVPTQWGFAHSFGFDGMYADMLFIIPMIFLAGVFGFVRGERINAIILLAFVLIAAYVSFRANMFVTIFIAAFFPLVFRPEIKDRRFFALFLLVIGANAVVLPLIYSGVTDWCSWGASNQMCVSPMTFISQHTPSEARAAVDPELAHVETYYGQRPVLADLYVEYANDAKYEAEAKFFFEKNVSTLGPYNISVMLLDNKWGTKRELGPADGATRVYDNGYIQIYRTSSG